MKDVGLVGVPYSGKSTLFTALTRTGAVGGRANQAVVSVADPRVDVLATMERSRKIVQATVRFVDVPGGVGSAQGLAGLRETDALAVVVRAFGPDADPVSELGEVEAEMILADLGAAETALESARRKLKGRGTKDAASGEVRTLERAHAALSAETPLRAAGLDEDQRKELRSLALLTLKPVVVVANVEEGAGLPDGLPEGAVAVSAEIEAETAAMAEDEARALLTEFGVVEPGLDLVVRASYQALDLITFLTTGEDETRAWEVRRGATAPEAAGRIHSDLQRGFIRAEVVSYEDLVTAGSWERAKAGGLLRVEGKDYVVREGDVLHVRFAV
jgi:ribosome-binding ATPase YchF (GTP1/OBG family)